MSKSSQESTLSGKWLPGPSPPRKAFIAASPAGVMGGTLPFGGSTTSEACRTGLPRSTQYEGGLMVTSLVPLENSSPSSEACFWARLSRSANSAFVSSALSPRLTARCMGMLAVAGHWPWRSGSPQEVFGGVQLVLAAGVADG